MASILDYIAMFQPSPKQVKDQLSQAIEGSWETSPSGLMPLRKNRLTGETQWIVPPALEALWGGVSAPQRALSGELPAYAEDANGRVTLNPQMVDDAAALASTIALGAAPIPKPKNALGMFGGEMAKTADKAALETAKQMAKDGASRDDIWNATGWFKGVDDKWRFEMPDEASKLGAKALAELMAGEGGRYGATQRSAPGVLWHDQLYAAYPELRNVDVDARYNDALTTSRGDMSYPAGSGGRPQITAQGNFLDAPSPNSVKSILLHEMQHGAQDIEGFAQGGDPSTLFGVPKDQLWKAARDAYEANQEFDDDALLAELLGTPAPAPKVPKKSWDALTEREKVKWLQAGRDRIYRQLAGEVEARNVQARMNMTAAERRARAPWLTQDVPDNLQIVRFREASR